MTTQILKPQRGRSMVEMLGVLAIIGVLSVGGIYGYTVAMNKYKANELVQVANMLRTIADSREGGNGGCVTLADANLTNPIPSLGNLEMIAEGGVVTMNLDNTEGSDVEDLTNAISQVDTSIQFDPAGNFTCSEPTE